MSEPIHRPGRLLTALVLMLLTGGCGPSVGFMAQSVVGEGGTLQRTTRFNCSRCSEGLIAKYELPADGSWHDEPYTWKNYQGKEIAGTRRTLVNDASHRRGRAVPPDYVRRGVSDNAHNQIGVTARDFFFVKTYTYEERFHDITNPERFRPAARKLYVQWVDVMAQTLDDALGASVDRATARDAYASVVGELYDRMMAGIEAAGMEFFDSDEASELEEELDEEVIATKVAAALAGARPADISEEEWYARIEAALDSDAAGRILEPALTGEVAESIFGVHGFTLFERYWFEISAALPGDVYQSNATGTADGALMWEFDHQVFILKDYVLSARSRIVYRARIMAASIILITLLLLAAGAYLWYHRQAGLQHTGMT